MFNVRSRAGVVAVTAGATLLVALPVVSLGAVPAVDHLTGNANETARDVVTSAPKPSLPAHAQAPAVRPTQAPRSAPADGHSGASRHSSQSRGRGHSRARARGHAGGSPQGEAAGQDDQAPQASDKKRKAASGDDTNAAPESGDETVSGLATDVEIADGSAAAPRDASPATLPFTGLQLALMGMFGLMAVAGGALLRRGVRDRRA
jgi:hypothetical protein